MNLTWHIVKKDLRALRWPLVLWVALIVAKLGLGVALLTTNGSGDSEQAFQHLNSLAMLLTGFECISIVLVAALIQGDLLVGTSAFWVTRPISGIRLLAAKLAGLGLVFGVLPVAVTLPWWLGCHLGWSEIVWAAAETAAVHGIVVLIGLFLAVVTDGLGRFLMWTFTLVAVAALTSFIVIAYFDRHHAVISADLATTRFVVGAVFALMGIAVVVVHQFLTRRIWRSVAMIGATYATIVAIALWWPWSRPINTRWNDWLARRAEASWPLGTEPPGLKFSVVRAELNRYPGTRTDRPSQLWVDYAVDGLPENQTLMPAIGSYGLRWPDGTAEEGWSWARSAGYAFVSVRALHLPTDRTKGPGWGQFLQIVKHKVAEHLVQEPAAYSLQARFALLEVAGASEVPTGPGERIVVGSRGERVGWVEKNGEEMLVTLVRHRPLSAHDFVVGMGNYLLGAATVGWPSQYLLVNPATQRVDAGSPRFSRSTRVAGVEISWETSAYRAMASAQTDKPRWEAIKALDDARLMRVTYRPLGSFSHKLEVDSLRPLQLNYPAN